ncbi:ferredoxin-NADP reductase/predicted pyridoxine 5'-phosphate oxidase superfamily flavin-nucleotide-binding protein [Thermocatellispora tengchongensis]|uniref:Ferredoxin-NADP reductase/predicted pyridoxine 5'-phosphate oxidase superfamily flavin-nucleotide-binding protein n=1 Tax=Thermocatellispora tengchongensis TaxID=1073253 RepID=A0A840P0M0_9ACTN|nr:pyridoxamine 5'-phosphate oxidase family protein [Thermocatellispora tengchongensis]MBB5134774.1 ferredoxin-NADP reductase/predicted pyridoxine 5'-phosphate oxidase superfamily flavin-nucleotide-binding protein [Thermocatellispora tengchongensis]
MSRITTVAQLEAIIGRPPAMVMMKELAELDDAGRRMLAIAPLAGFGYRDDEGRPRTTVVGGKPGFAEVESPARIAFATDVDASGPVSFVFLLPGVGETLRVNGSVAERSPGRIVVAVSQVYIHCARAILRSRLWDPVVPAAPVPAVADGPLSAPGVAGFLAATPFLIVSSWDRDGGSDTSPRGDVPGFVRVIDGHTLVIPDRRGNKRADTSRNLLADDRISVAMLVPGRTDVLHVSGTAVITDDASLLADMAQGAAVPQAALIITVERAELRRNQAVAAANVWDRGNRVDAATLAELMALTTRQLGVKKPALRRLSGALAVFSRLIRRVMDATYRRALEKEGYGLATGTRLGRPVRVIDVIRETPDAVTLVLSGADTGFAPGQFYTLIMDIEGRTFRRAYSATSVPGTDRLALTVKRDGLCSTYLNDHARVGTEMRVLGPSGDFRVADPAAAGAEYVLIGAGSGITPLMSIIRTVLAASPDATITLIYGNRTEADIIFAGELTALRDAHPGRLTVHHVLSRPGPGWTGRTGRIGPDHLIYLERAHYYICGPATMPAAVREALTGLGVSSDRLHEERFTSVPAADPEAADSEQAVRTMTVDNVGEVVVGAGQTMLDAGLAAGVPMPYSCTVGSCGECRVRLLRGEVRGIVEDGGVLTCVSYPLTDTAVAITPAEPGD